MAHVSDDALDETFVKLFLQHNLDNLTADFLLEKGANINHLDKTGSGAIHYSTKASNRTHIDYLQQHKATLELPDRHGNTPLHYAVLLNDQNLANWLLSQTRLTINATNNDGLTPIHFAAQTEFLEIQMAWLKSLGADFAARTVSGWRPIDYAIQRVRDDNVMLEDATKKLEGLGLPGSTEGIGIKGKKLAQLDASLQKKTVKARNRRGSIMALSSVGAGVNDDKDPQQWREDSLNAPLKQKPPTPRVGAGKRRNALEGAEHVPWKQLRKLWWHDDPPKGPPKLPLVIEAARLGQKNRVEMLVHQKLHYRHPDSFEARNDCDKTALLYAVTHGHTAIAKTLMSAGADPFDMKGKAEKHAAQIVVDREKRGVRRFERSERERLQKEKETLKIELLKRQEQERIRNKERIWNERYGSDHAVTLNKQLDLHQGVLDLSDKLTNELTARVARMESELNNDPFQFLATQNIIVVDQLLHVLLMRMEGNVTGVSPYTQHSDPSWPPVVKFGIPNLGWRVRECIRMLNHLSTKHRVSKGYANFSKMESEGIPIVRRRMKKKQVAVAEEMDSSDDEDTMTNMMLNML